MTDQTKVEGSYLKERYRKRVKRELYKKEK